MDLPTTSPLRGLVEVTRLLRARRDLPALLDAVARTIGQSLGYHTVAVNLYRPAWDDFEVTAVHGSGEARALLLGDVHDRKDWTVVLAEQFERRGAYLVPHGSVDWNSLGPIYTPGGGHPTDPDAWDPEDALFVPMRDQDGGLLGIISVDEPLSGHRPTDEELDLLVSLADHAALAVEEAREAAQAARHQRALEELLAVSSRITSETASEEILRRVCNGIHDALEFRNVCAALVEPTDGALVPHAAVGWRLEEIYSHLAVKLAQIEPLLDDRYLHEGCYLLTHAQARAVLAPDFDFYPSQLNGRGPRAWKRHALLVPLLDGDGVLLGIIWADNPSDRLVPSADRLQALRIFANDAAAALVSTRQVGELRFLADHDALTRLLNRRAFVGRLQGEVARAARYGRPFSLVVADLDRFKRLNDRYGHSAGDSALVTFATILADALRKPDAAFRIGGDEFAALLAEASADDVRRVVGRIRLFVGRTVSDAEPWLTDLTASFGFASCPADAADSQTLFRLADEALYDAKRAGVSVRSVAGA